jgi:hypothetical protein
MKRVVTLLGVLGFLFGATASAIAAPVAPCTVLTPITNLPHYGIAETTDFLGVDRFAAPGPEMYACTVPANLTPVVVLFDLVEPSGTSVSDYLNVALAQAGVITLQSDPFSPELGLAFRATVAGILVSRIAETGLEGDNGVTIFGSSAHLGFDLTVHSDVPGTPEGVVPQPATWLLIMLGVVAMAVAARRAQRA